MLNKFTQCTYGFTLSCLTLRTATKNEIVKAYRKLAREWHPDSYDGEDKEKAEKMFYDIAAAKEVLTDPGECSDSGGPHFQA